MGIVSSILTFKSILDKITNNFFRKNDIDDYSFESSLIEVCDDAILSEMLPNFDKNPLLVFLKQDSVKKIITQKYKKTEKSPQQIEEEFVQLFIQCCPIGENSNEKTARTIFQLIVYEYEKLIDAKIIDDDLGAQTYRIQDIFNEQRQNDDISGEKIESVLKIVQDLSDNQTSDEFVQQELEWTISHIRKYEFELAKSRILRLLGILEKEPKKYSKELSKAYHFLGIIYNRLKDEGGDFEQAEQYLLSSLNYDPGYFKAKATLASVYIRKDGKENFQKAYSMIKSVWDESAEKEPQFLEILLWSISFSQSSEKAIEFFEASVDNQEMAKTNDILSNIVSRLYLDIGNLSKAQEWINHALELNPESSNNLFIEGSLLINKAFKENILPSFFEIVPKFNNNGPIELALNSFLKALKFCDANQDLFLEQGIKTEAYLCSVILNLSKKEEFENLRSTIKESDLPDRESQKLFFIDFVKSFNDRQFGVAYQKLIKLKMWQLMPYEVKRKFSKIFLKCGGIEEAKLILISLSQEAKDKNDIQYWVDFSILEALSGNKNGMFHSLRQAKTVSKNTPYEELVLAHCNGIIQRYLEEGKEIDRWIDHIREYSTKYPENKLVTSIKAIDDDGNLTPEIKDIISKKQQQSENIKKMYKELCIPSYILEGYYGNTYAQVLNTRNDLDFWIKYYEPDLHFEKEMTAIFQNADTFVFDYSSLLNLAKMDLLEELGKTEKKLLITHSLFSKIQFELMVYENQNLRNLWNFLRNTDLISIVDIDANPMEYEQIKDNLDKWIIDSIELVKKNENTVFFSDDYNFLQLLREFHEKGCITYFFLKFLLENAYIDSKTFGLSIGCLAERIYVFLPFDGEDLFHIVMNDDCKIKLRSYHLINQITLPDSTASKFTGQLWYFIERLWQSGSNSEKKQDWLKLITDRVITAIKSNKISKNQREQTLLIHDTIVIWRTAILSSSSIELSVIEKDFIEIFDKESFCEMKDTIKAIIESKKAELNIPKS